jgi:hypothetical protein
MATLILADGHRYNNYSIKVDLCFNKSAVEAAMYPEDSRYFRLEFKGGYAIVPDKEDILKAIENTDEFKKKIIAYMPTLEQIQVNEAELLQKERDEAMQKILEIDKKMESIKPKTATKEKSKKATTDEPSDKEVA